MVIKVLQRRKSLVGLLSNKNDESTVDQDGIDDAATALELALHESTHPSQSAGVMVSTLDLTSSKSIIVTEQQREGGDDDHATVSAPKEEKTLIDEYPKSAKIKSQSKATEIRTKQKSFVAQKIMNGNATGKKEKDESSPKHWVRTFQRGTADSGDTMLPSLQISITAALLTGLVAIAEKTKRSSHTKNEGATTANDLVAGYVRLIPSKSVSLVPFSPIVVKSLPISPMIQNNMTAKDGQSFVIWANDHPHGSGTLMLETKASSKEPVVTLEIGVVSNEHTLPLGTATFQPGTTDIYNRRRHLKVEKLRIPQGSGLFRRKLQLGDAILGSEYRLIRDSFLSLKVDVIQGQRSAAPMSASSVDDTTTQRRQITPAGLERTFSSASLASEVRLLTTSGQQHDCGVSLVLGFFAAVCCWCFAESTVSGKGIKKTNLDETADDEGGSTDADSCVTKHVQSNECCWFGNNAEAQHELVETGAAITLDDTTLNQSAEKSDCPASDGEAIMIDDQLTSKEVELSTSAPALADCRILNGSPLVNDEAINSSKDIGGNDNNLCEVVSNKSDLEERDIGSGGPGYVANICGACFGDVDVEEMQTLQLRARKESLESKEYDHGDTFSAAKSFAETVSTQVVRSGLCTTWFGEEDVERLLPVGQRSVPLAHAKAGNRDRVAIAGLSIDKAISKESSAIEYSQSGTMSTAGNSSLARSQTRSIGDVLKGDKHDSDFSTRYTSYSTDFTSAQQEDTPGNGCFPFMSGMDVGTGSASTSYDSSASGDTLTVFSLSALHLSQKQASQSRPVGVSLVDADENQRVL